MSSEIVLVDLIKTLKKLFFHLLRKWKLLLLVGFLSALIGIGYVWLQDPKYTAQLNFVSDNGNGGGGLSAYAGIASQFGIDLGGGSGSAFDGDNLIELMKTKNLVVKTLLSKYDDKTLMIEQYIKNNKGVKKELQLSFNSQAVTQGWIGDSILNLVYERIVKKNLNIEKLDKKLDFVYIKYQDKDQFFAKKFVETLATSTIDFYTEYKTKKNAANVAVLQKQADSVRVMLFGGIENIAAVSDLNVNPLKKALVVPGQKKSIDNTVNAALYTELQKNLQLAKLMLLKETPLIKIIDNPILPLKNEKMGRIFGGIIFGFVGCIIATLIIGINFLYFKKGRDIN